MDKYSKKELAAMRKLHKRLVDEMYDVIGDDILSEEAAILVAGKVAVVCMSNMPVTEEGEAALQIFLDDVDSMFSEAASELIH